MQAFPITEAAPNPYTTDIIGMMRTTRIPVRQADSNSIELLPNVFIAGSQKSGTTALARYLSEHPNCIVTQPKEPCVFSKHENLKNLQVYTQYFHTGDGSNAKILVDASTSYMCEPYAAVRIRDVLGPHIRLIFILRNPIERTISGYFHMFKRDDETRPLNGLLRNLPSTLDAAVLAEELGIEIALSEGRIRTNRYRERYDDYLWPFRYIGNSVYTALLKPYLSNFSRENVYIIFTEDLRLSPDVVYGELLAYLGLNPCSFPNIIGRVYNETVIRRPGTINRIARDVMPNISLGALKAAIPWLGYLYRKVLFSPRPSISKEHQEVLGRLFRDETEAVSTIVGRDLREIGWP